MSVPVPASRPGEPPTFVGKFAASYLSGRLSGLGRSEVRLLFGLTVAQAAATLAAVTIGTEVGIFTDKLLSAALVVVLVTVIVAGIVTSSAARKLAPPLEPELTTDTGDVIA